ncbi:O-antigen ligase [Devosia subaequoris]|uniref:O-antigen ligase n=1 Tax=Devosia subaequoris TaxID=395930 RepID=A0A7W6IQ85_9HYPH|nr:O-antigen ligase [Devosia subaequoris]MCP1211034.1 O-antigen ligase family protein [Devosia subaequoris]
MLFALAPLPFASARPFLWALWATYVGAIAIVFFAWQLRSGASLRVNPIEFRLPAALVAVTLLMLVAQVLPIGSFLIASDGAISLTAPQISIAPGQTVLMLARQLTYALVAVLVMQIAASDNRRNVLLHGLIAIALAYGAYGLIALRLGDTILGLPKWAYLGSITGSFVNRNSFATFIGFGAILTLAHGCAIMRRQAERHKDDGLINGLLSKVILYGAAYTFLILVLIGTQSRMGLFAALAGSAVVVLATLLSIRRLGLILLIAPLALATFIGLLWLLGGGLLERIESDGFDSSTRWVLYEQILRLIALRPWTGFGGGTFEIAFPIVHTLPLPADVSFNLAHNTYLALWSELGLIGGSFLILAIAFVTVKLVTALLANHGSWTAEIAALGVIFQVAIHSMVDFSLEIPANTLVFVAILATGLATTSRTKTMRTRS